MMSPGDFTSKVREVILAIPRGSVLSYGQVALRAGRPGGARAVAGVLRNTRGLPWWRVVRSDGTLAEQVADEQALRLRSEGILVEGRRLRLQK